MKLIINKMILVVLVAIILCPWTIVVNCNRAKDDFFQKPGTEVVDILRARGYFAKNYEFITDDGYILTITRGLNPLINDGVHGLKSKVPILFIHGTMTNANEFVVHSFDAKAENFLSHGDPSKLDTKEAIDLYAKYPSSKSLPMLAMNFGHEVWILNRRGTNLSRQYIKNYKPKRGVLSPVEKLINAYKQAGRWPIDEFTAAAEVRWRNEQERLINPLTEFVELPKINNVDRNEKGNPRNNSKLIPALANAPAAFVNYFRGSEIKTVAKDVGYWNFSLDEQLAYDLPNSIDFVRFVTNQDKIALLGHSGGGALVSLVHVMNPTEMNRKVIKTIAWGSSALLGKKSSIHLLSLATQFISDKGPSSNPLLSFPMQAFLEIICGLEILQKTICEFVGGVSLGFTGGQAPYRSEFFTTHFVPSSAKEMIQQMQFARSTVSKMYDYNQAGLNLKAYGQTSAPQYDPALIKSHHLSIWSSPTDSVTTANDVELFTSQMKVPHKVFLVDQKGLKFNHGSYTWHRDVAKISVIPSFMDIVSMNHLIKPLSRRERNLLHDRFIVSS